MKRRKLFLFAALFCAISAFAQEVSVDWAVWGVVSPSATDFAVQKPQILIRNTKSAAATGYTCGLYVDGVFLGEKSTDKTVNGFRNDTVVFDTYSFELGKTYEIKAYVRAAEGCTDTKVSNKADTSMKAYEIDVLSVVLDYDVESGLTNASISGKTEVAAEYFGLMGRKVNAGTAGVSIKVATMSDGSKVATKVMNR